MLMACGSNGLLLKVINFYGFANNLMAICNHVGKLVAIITGICTNSSIVLEFV